MESDLLAAYIDILSQTRSDVPTEPKKLTELICDQFGVEVSEKAIREFMENPFIEPSSGLIEEDDRRIHLSALGYGYA